MNIGDKVVCVLSGVCGVIVKIYTPTAEVLPGSTFDIVLKEAAADVAEVRHGRWVFDHMTGEWSYYSHCSECNYQEFFANEDVEKRHKYCLNCGARMGKEANHGN